MDEDDWLARRFAAHGPHLRAVAYRMLGSATEADDAVQEAWLRLDRAGPEGIDNLGGWLTTVVARVCLDMLRSRRSRREEALEHAGTDGEGGPDPEQEAMVADSVGLAMLVVLDTLAPAERLAFVLHDMFAVPFDEIAPIVDRSPAAARQLASRARRRVQGAPAASGPDLARQRAVVEAFRAAARDGDFAGLLAVLDADVVLRADAPPGRVLRGARTVAGGAVGFARMSRDAELVLVDGTVGLIAAPPGAGAAVMRFTISGDRITALEAITDSEALAALDLALVP